MSSIGEEFLSELARIELRAGKDPRALMKLLCELALEREEFVAVGYRDTTMQTRLRHARIPDDVKEIMSQALVWIWKDEEMHSIYTRGLLMKLGGKAERLKALVVQLAGAIGGWCGSVMQHATWSQSPASRLVALLLSKFGELAGKVPPQVKPHLQYSSFRQFCRLNVELEETARLGWERLLMLVTSGWCPDEIMARDFRRIMLDEQRHGRVFEIFAEVLNDQDELIDNIRAADLQAGIEKVGQYFLPRQLRSCPAEDHPVGTGGQVFVLEDVHGDGLPAHLRASLDQAGLHALLQARARRLNKSIDRLSVAIKTSFMMGYSKKDPSPLVSKEVLHGFVEFLRSLGVTSITVLESSNIYDQFFQGRSVPEVARYFDMNSELYEIVDSSSDQVAHDFEHGFSNYSISKTWRDADFRISLSKLRSHPVSSVYLSLANLDAMAGRCDKFIFLERQAHLDTATVMLVDASPPHFCFIDAYENVPDGIAGVMGCRKPKSPRRFYAGSDGLSVDIVAARHAGIREPQQSSILRTACYWFGDPSSKITVVGRDNDIDGWVGPYCDEWHTALGLIAYPVYELGSGRGALFVPEMDEEAFPRLQKPGLFQALAEEFVRALLGLRGIAR